MKTLVESANRFLEEDINDFQCERKIRMALFDERKEINNLILAIMEKIRVKRDSYDRDLDVKIRKELTDISNELFDLTGTINERS